MRAFVRIIMDAVAVLALILCVATVALWVRSTRISDTLYWCVTDDAPSPPLAATAVRLTVTSDAGQLRFARAVSEAQWHSEWFRDELVLRHGDRLSERGFGWSKSENSGSIAGQIHRRLEVTFPTWSLAVMLGALPTLRAIAFVRRRRRRRPTFGCPKCGYDLRATPDRCPECGTVPTTKPARPGGAGG
jgi:hypothetical protein